MACGAEATTTPPALASVIPGKVLVISYQTSSPRVDRQIANYEEFNKEFKLAVETGFAYSYWCGNADCEAKIKEETKATMRCVPLDQKLGHESAHSSASASCVYCGQPARERAIFGRAY